MFSKKFTENLGKFSLSICGRFLYLLNLGKRSHIPFNALAPYT